MTKIFADGADVKTMLELKRQGVVQGFTTNPTLMRQAGVTDYRAFGREVLAAIPDLPVSFEVISDYLDNMEEQARELASWGKNVYVKIPITNTRGVSTLMLIRGLSSQGIKVNITAVTTREQVAEVANVLGYNTPAYVSVFAGRVADTGVDPLPLMKDVLWLLPKNVELIWASPREVFNVVQARQIGCHIITVTPDILKKLHLLGKDLTVYSRETVQMFFNDATASGLTL